MSLGDVEVVTVSGRVHADLQTAAHAIREEHRQVEEALRSGFSNALTHAIQAGRRLAHAKSLVPHGGWGAWVEQNLFGIDARTERLYRQLAEAADAGRLQSGSALPVVSIRQARELLAGATSQRTDGAASGGRADRPRRRHKADPIDRLLDHGEPFGVDEDLDAEDLEDELAGQLRDRYPTHAAEWAEWWADRFNEAGRRVR